MFFRRAGFEPATYGYLLSTTVHRSTNWAIDGIYIGSTETYLYLIFQ